MLRSRIPVIQRSSAGVGSCWRRNAGGGAQHHIRFTSTSTAISFPSIYDKHSTNWREWFAPAEYENPWDAGSTRLLPLEQFASHEYASKHVIYMLQNFHHYQSSKVTTELCNSVLSNLLELQPTLHKRDMTEEEMAKSRAVANRANAILENMELFDLRAADSSNTTTTTRLARALPKPNRDSYHAVLLIFSRTYGDASVPNQTMQIIERMQLRYERFTELDMKPINFHYNCVLSAWLRSTDPERSVHAAQLFLDRMLGTDLVDASSCVHMLRICIYGTDNSERSKLLGANVAVKIWQELFERSPATTTTTTTTTAHEQQLNPIQVVAPKVGSHFYSHFLQAIRPLESSPPSLALRTQYFDACMERAIRCGKVNRFVLQEFFVQVKHQETLNKYLGPYVRLVRGMATETAVSKLMTLIPASWTEYADGKEEADSGAQ